MKINVEIESGSFEKVIQEGISALSKEELGSIIKQVVYEAFTKCEDFKNLLVYREGGGYGPSELRLGKLAEEAVKSINVDEELAEIKKRMIKALMDNHLQIVEDTLFRCMIDKITYSDHFMDNLRETIRRINWEAQNRE
jgi:hypothetical protein